MYFSTLFRTKENLNLDKSTLTILRYIAIFGQFFAINIVFFYLNLKFPIFESYIIIFIGLITNLFLQFKIKVNQLKDLQNSYGPISAIVNTGESWKASHDIRVDTASSIIKEK